MANSNNTSLVRQLVPKSYSFDGYNEINCSCPRDKPFFSDHTVNMGNYCMTVRLSDSATISLIFASTCNFGKVTFETYNLKLETYVSKLKKAVQNSCDFITFGIKVNYESQSTCATCVGKNKSCQYLWHKRPKVCFAAVSFNLSEVKEALATYYEITKNNNLQTNGGNSTMKNNKNIFGMNFEFGISKDTNIASTLMGVAVRNRETGAWYTFDQNTNTRTNIANIKMGNFPVFLLPAKNLEVGDLIKQSGKYYYVKSVNATNTITLLSAEDGVVQEMLPEKSIIPGLNLFTKVVAFDAKSLTDAGSNQNMGSNVLAAMCMMQWSGSNNNADFSLDNIDDDSFNGLGSCLPMLMAMNGTTLGDGMFNNADGSLNLPMLMAMGSSSSDSDSNGMMQMLVLGQLLGGNNNSLLGNSPALVSTETASNESVICEKCKKTYGSEISFCPTCGSKTKPVSTTCRKCNATLTKGAAFCHKCGTKVTPDTCPKCGRAITEDGDFCAGCGHNLKSSPADEVANAETATTES